MQKEPLLFLPGRSVPLQNHEKEPGENEKGDGFAVFCLGGWKIVAKEKAGLYNKHICFFIKSSRKERTGLCTKKYLFPRFSG